MQSLDELDELFFQRVYERHYGLPWCIGETEQLKIRESTEEDVEKLLAFFTDEEARRWLFEGEGKLFSEEERGKTEGLCSKPVWLLWLWFLLVLWKETGELAAWAGFQERQYQGKQVLELGYLTAPSFRRQGIASEAVGLLSEEMEDLTGEIKAFIFCHPENLASRRTAEKLCHLYPEHFQLVLEEL